MTVGLQPFEGVELIEIAALLAHLLAHGRHDPGTCDDCDAARVVVAGVGTVAEVACELRTARVVPLAELLRRGGVWRWECEARSGASAREAL